MANDPFVSAVDSELKHWPGVEAAWDKTKRHRKVHLSFNGKKKFVMMPSTASDNVRGPKNQVTQIRSTLKSLGAQRLDVIPKSKREKEEVKDMTSEVKMAVTDSMVMVSVPESSELYSKFADKSHRPTGMWTLELRSNPALNGVPRLAIVRKEPPPPGKKKSGIAGGSHNKMSKAFKLAIQSHLLPMFEKNLGQFGMTPIKTREVHSNEIVFDVPKDRKKLILRGSKKRESEDVKKVETKETQQLPKDLPILTPEPEKSEEVQPPLIVKPEVHIPRRIYLEPVQAPLDVDKCIKFLNLMKDEKGQNLRFTIEENGYLSYVMKGGRR